MIYLNVDVFGTTGSRLEWHISAMLGVLLPLNIIPTLLWAYLIFILWLAFSSASLSVLALVMLRRMRSFFTFLFWELIYIFVCSYCNSSGFFLMTFCCLSSSSICACLMFSSRDTRSLLLNSSLSVKYSSSFYSRSTSGT